MKPNISQIIRSTLYKQFLLCFLVSLCACFYRINFGLSMLWGSIIVIVPNVFFVALLFRRWRQRSRLSIIVSLYLGELIKLIFSGVLAIFSVKIFSEGIPVGGLLLGMALAYIAFWALASGAVFKTKRMEATG